MNDVIGELNWLAIIIGGVAYYMLGGLWFSAIAFEKIWDKAIGFDRPKEWKPSTIYYVGPLIGCLAAALATAIIVYAIDVESYAETAVLGLTAGLGYAASTTFTNAITPRTPHPLTFAGLVGSYHTIGIIVAALIIFAGR